MIFPELADSAAIKDLVTTYGGGLLLLVSSVTMFVGYILMVIAIHYSRGTRIWMMVAGLICIIGLRIYTGSYFVSLGITISLLITQSSEVKHLAIGRWAINTLVYSLVGWFIGYVAFLNSPSLTLPTLAGMRAEGSEEPDSSTLEAFQPRPASSAPTVTPGVTASTPPPVAEAPPRPLVVPDRGSIQPMRLALRTRERKLLDRKRDLRKNDYEAALWLTEDIKRYNVDLASFHEQAVRLDPRYASVPLPEPSPAPSAALASAAAKAKSRPR